MHAFWSLAPSYYCTEALIQPAHDPQLLIEWQHNGSPLTAGHRFRTVHEQGYVAMDILYIYPEDSGQYTCTAKNSLGSAQISCQLGCIAKQTILSDPNNPESWRRIKEMEEAVPIVPEEPEAPKMKPVFTTALPAEVVEVKEGQSVHFECDVQPARDPKLKIDWFLDGQPLKQGMSSI